VDEARAQHEPVVAMLAQKLEHSGAGSALPQRSTAVTQLRKGESAEGGRAGFELRFWIGVW